MTCISRNKLTECALICYDPGLLNSIKYLPENHTLNAQIHRNISEKSSGEGVYTWNHDFLHSYTQNTCLIPLIILYQLVFCYRYSMFTSVKIFIDKFQLAIHTELSVRHICRNSCLFSQLFFFPLKHFVNRSCTFFGC